MSRKLYVLLDFSVYSKSELQLAKKWSDWYNLEIVVLHEMEMPLPTMATYEQRLKILYDLKREVSKLWFPLVEEVFGNSLLPKFEILDQPLITYLKKHLGSSGEDLIMMGLKGSGKLKQIFIGSMVNMVVEQLNHITIAVPKSLCDFEPNQLLVSVHPKFDFNDEAFKKLMEVIPKSIQSILYMSVTNEEDDQEEIRDFLTHISSINYVGLQSKAIIFSGNDAFSEIKNHFTGRSDFILVLQKGSRSFTDKLFRKLMVNELVYEGSIPLIILPS
jgi:hypothetical protein